LKPGFFVRERDLEMNNGHGRMMLRFDNQRPSINKLYPEESMNEEMKA
jgi:hypothetical protein